MTDTERTLDMRGCPCPEPVIKTRAAIEDPTVTKIIVIVDNDAAAENVSRTARNLRCEVSVSTALEGRCEITIAKTPETQSTLPDAPASDSVCGTTRKTVVLFSQETFGSGDPDFGRALLLAFVGTLSKLPHPPSALIFLNSGAHLVCDDTPFVDAVKALDKDGTTILVCGTCLDFYHLDARKQVGTVTNMMEIATVLLEADNVIRP